MRRGAETNREEGCCALLCVEALICFQNGVTCFLARGAIIKPSFWSLARQLVQHDIVDIATACVGMANNQNGISQKNCTGIRESVTLDCNDVATGVTTGMTLPTHA